MEATLQGIYGIFNATDVCLYVGQSTDAESRWATHRRQLKRGAHHNYSLQDWVDSMGLDTLEFKLVEEVPDGHLLADKEKEWFERLRPKFWGRKPGNTWRWTELSEQTLDQMKRKRAEARHERLIALNAKWGKRCRDLYIGGSTMEGIACRLSISYGSVRRILEAQGVPARVGREARGLSITNSRYQQAQKALETGQSFTELATQWNCSLTTVKTLLVEMDLWRPRSTESVTSLYALSATELSKTMSDGKAKGLSLGAIANDLGVGRSTLIRALKKSAQ